MVGLAASGGQVRPSGGLAAFGCFAGILGIAVIVFGFMYLFLVEKMGRRFKEAAQMARASWAAAAFVARTPQA